MTAQLSMANPTSAAPVQASTLITDQQLVLRYLDNLEKVRTFLQIVKCGYLRSEGNLIVFKKYLARTQLLAIFNILIGHPTVDNYFTEEYWDTLSYQLVRAWSSLYGLQYQRNHLIAFIQELRNH